MQPGLLYASFTLTGTRFSSAHGVPGDELEPGISAAQQAHSHHTQSFFADASLDLSLGLTDRVGVDVALPLRTAWQSTEYWGLHDEVLSKFSSIHHIDGWKTGIGDVPISLKLRVLAPTPERKIRLDIRPGVTLPFGGTEPDPDELARAGMPHRHLFFGTGTLDPQLGMDGSWDLGAVQLVGYGYGRMPLYANKYNYQAGARAAGGLGASFSAGLEQFRFLVQPEFYHENVSAWGSDIAEMSGRTDVLLGVGATWLPAPMWALQVRAKIPLKTWSEMDSVTAPWFLMVTVARAVDLFAK